MTYTGKIPVLSGIIIISLLLLPIVACADSGSIDSDSIIVYGMYPTSGSLTVQGEGCLKAFELAVSDFNEYLADINSKKRIFPYITAITSDTESVLAELTKLDDVKATAVITYLSDVQADAVRDFCTAHGILLLATGPVSPHLASPDDNLIRFNPDNTVQGRVAARWFAERGITRIVPLVCDDQRSGGLINAVSQSLGEGISMEEITWYSPDTTNFADALSRLDQKTKTVLTSLDPEKVAIYAVTSNELQSIFTEATKDEYENLAKVAWIGCDTNALLPELTGTSKPAEYAYARNFTAFSLGSDRTVKNSPTYQALPIITEGKSPSGYTLATYDTTWIALKALIMDGSPDIRSMEDAVLKMAEQHYGLSGKFRMDINGDRNTAVYTIWELSKDDDGITWKETANAEIQNDSKDSSAISITPIST